MMQSSTRKSIRTTLVLCALTLFSNAYGDQASTPEGTVKDFYTWEIHDQDGSAHTLLGPIRHLLTTELDKLLTATDTYQNACRKLAAPDTKPWILDADPWYYNAADGAKALEGTALLASSESAAQVKAKLSYDDYKWTDTVVLQKVNDRWRIADIRFEQGGGLIQSLREFIGHDCSKD